MKKDCDFPHAGHFEECCDMPPPTPMTPTDREAMLTVIYKWMPPGSDPNRALGLRDAILSLITRTGEVEHTGSTVSEHMTDQHRCSCGWESAWYFDGAEFAKDEWRAHVAALAQPQQHIEEGRPNAVTVYSNRETI